MKFKKTILKPIVENLSEKWLLDPKNKYIVDELKKALEQKADKEVDLESFEKNNEDKLN